MRGCRIAPWVLVVAWVLPLGLRAQPAASKRPREPIMGGPCEGCDAVFDDLPAELTAHARIGSKSEPGEPMRIEGTVFDRNDRPAAGVIVYAFQADADGIYPGADRGRDTIRRHGRLRAWARTDAQGRYTFDTIRPASYPETRIPAHVHMHIIEVGKCTYPIDDLRFEDDPLLTVRYRSRPTGRRDIGIAKPKKDPQGRWIVTRDVRLGEEAPACP